MTESPAASPSPALSEESSIPKQKKLLDASELTNMIQNKIEQLEITATAETEEERELGISM